MRPSWWLLVPVLASCVSCSDLSKFCEAAPCPSLAGPSRVQPLPSLVDPPTTVKPGEVVTLQVHVNLNGLPTGTVLTWVRPDGVRSATLVDVPGRFRIEAASLEFTGDTTLTLSVAPGAVPGRLADNLTLALQQAPTYFGSYGPLPIDLTVVP